MFFRCLKLYFNNNQKVKDYFRMWFRYNNNPKINESQFPGIMFEDIIETKKCYTIKILISNLNSNGAVSCVYETMSQNSSKMYLNVYYNHYSYITDFLKYDKKLQCAKCSKISLRYGIRRDIHPNVMKEHNISFQVVSIKHNQLVLIN